MAGHRHPSAPRAGSEVPLARCLLWVLGLMASALGQRQFSVPLRLDPALGDVRAAVDLTGDGRPDLLHYFWNPTNPFRSVTVQVNDGTGRFAPRPPLILPPWTAEDIRLTDVTGDGRLDLIATTPPVVPPSPSTAILVFPGDGQGGFLPFIISPIGRNLLSWDLADVNGDGRPDIAARAEIPITLTNELQWYRNTGAGTFVPLGTPLILPIPGLSIPFNLVAVDGNADGIPDVLGADNVGFTMAAYLTAANFDIQPAGSYPLGIAAPLARTFASDLNRDGLADLVTWGVSGIGTVQIRPQLAAPGGGYVVQAAIATGVMANPTVFTADWDADGSEEILVHGDLVGAGTGYGLLAYRWSVASGGPPAWQIQASSRLASSLGGMTADLDGDGRTDLAVGSDLLFGDASSRAPVTLVNGVPSSFDLAPMATDLDSDGDIDLLLSDGMFDENRGDATFARRSIGWPSPIPGALANPGRAVGDLDADGRVDIVVSQVALATPLPGTTILQYRRYEWTGSGTVVDLGPLSTSPAQLAGTQTADIDQDGDLDLVGIGYQLNSGSGLFGPIVSPWPSWSVADAADIDGDGDPDFIAISQSPGPPHVAIIRTSFPNFTIQPISTPETATGTAIAELRAGFADLDQDGDPDAFADHSNGSDIAILANATGNLAFFSSLTLDPSATGVRNNTMFAADIDVDGRPEILVRDGSELWVCESLGTSLNFRPPLRYALAGVSGAADLDGDGDPELFGSARFAWGFQRHRTDWGFARQFGTSTAGTLGQLPQLGAIGPFRPGSTLQLRVQNLLGQTAGLIGVASAPTTLMDFPIPGVHTYGQPWLFFIPFAATGPQGAPGVGSFTLPLAIPPVLSGLSLTCQSAAADATHPTGIVVSHGVTIQFGL